jgi:hypothetical protein
MIRVYSDRIFFFDGSHVVGNRSHGTEKLK